MTDTERARRLREWEAGLVESVGRLLSSADAKGEAPEQATLQLQLDRFVVESVDRAMCEMVSDSSAANTRKVLLRSTVTSALLERQVDLVASRRTAARRRDGARPGTVAFGAVAAGLMLRRVPDVAGRLQSVELALAPRLVRKLDTTLEWVLEDRLDERERGQWRDRRFSDLRDAFVEAGLRTWLNERRVLGSGDHPARVHRSAVAIRRSFRRPG